MATTHPRTDSSTDPIDQIAGADEGVRHSKDDAISPRQFELLVEATYDMDPYYGQQCRLVLFCCGRLGMRRGELGHMTSEWINRDDKYNVIEIPAHEPCRKGRDGGICGSCRQYVDQKAGVRTDQAYADAHAQLGLKNELEPGGGEAVAAVADAAPLAAEYWQPKSECGAREVPYTALTRAGIYVDRFFEQYDEWPVSVTVINRRVDRVVNACDRVDVDNLFPHALRASAANYWVRRGLDERPLKYLFGWEKMVTSASYIERNADRAIGAIHAVAP